MTAASSRIHYFSLYLWCWLSGSVESWTSSPFSTARIIKGRPSTSSPSSSSPWSMGDIDASRRKSLLFSLMDEEEEEEQEQEEPVVMAIESLSPSQIVELVELSFLQSVFAMAQGKLEELQLFIIAVKTASTHEPSVSNLLKSLDDLADQQKLVPDTTTEKEDRPQPLDPKERALRSTWIQVIYWLVAYLSSQEEDNTTTIIDVEDIDPTITKRYSTEIIDDLVAIQKSGLGLNAQAFVERRQEHFFPTATNNPLLLDEQDAIDPIDKAIVSQTIKVLFYTLLVLADDGDNATIITDSPSTTSSDNYSMETESSASEKEESSPEESSKTSKKQSKSKTKRSGGRGFGG